MEEKPQQDITYEASSTVDKDFHSHSAQRLSRYFLIIPLFIGTILVLIFSYFYIWYKPSITSQNNLNSPSLSPTWQDESKSNWKTYQGKYFSFKYPPSWAEEIIPSSLKRPEDLERIDLRLPGSAVFVASYKNYAYGYSIQSLGQSSQSITVDGREAKLEEVKGIEGSPLPEGYSIITVVVRGSENTSYTIVFNGDRSEITNELVNQILSTFKFLDTTSPSDISSWPTTAPELFSSDQTYVVNQRRIGDYNHISIDHIDGLSITKDLVKDNEKEIGMGTKIKCQCRVTVGKWISYTQFTLKIVSSLDEEYEYTVDAPSGKVIESSLKRIK